MRGLCLLLLLGCHAGEGDDVTRNRPGGDPSHDPTLPDGGLRGDLAPSSGDLAPSSGDLAPSSSGILSGGPCISGAAGATALLVLWVDGGGRAVPQIEAFGLPDATREKVGAFGFTVGFTPTFDDSFLAQGGLVLDGSDFVDLELSTAGVSSIRGGTVSIFGRSFSTGASGSFNWQSFTGSGATASDFVANSAPYEWYQADLAGAIAPADSGVLLRLKAGPSSGSLIVNRIEICLDAS